jgi:two-component system, NarL family, nitrate/nitrite response regulator NarL
MHFFLTPDGRPQPSWRQAFADVTASAVATDALAAAEVIWLDERLADAPGLLATIRQSGRPWVVVSLAPQQDRALTALATGARGYCHALAAPEMLRDVAAAVCHGGLWVGADLVQRLLRSLPTPSAELVDDDLALLSERERETAQLVAEGLSNKEIARKLEITERTVKAHVSSVFAKLGLRDRLQLALRFGRRPS